MAVKLIGIYSIWCVASGGVYIGQSCDIEHRRKEHLRKLRYGSHRNPHLQHAFNLYGEKSFEFVVLRECKKEELNHWEKYHIEVTRKNFGKMCYNVTNGGDSEPKTKEHKEKIGRGNRGKIRSRSVKEKISNSLKSFYASRTNPFKGKTHDEETRKRMSQSKKGKPWTLAQYRARGLA